MNNQSHEYQKQFRSAPPAVQIPPYAPNQSGQMQSPVLVTNSGISASGANPFQQGSSTQIPPMQGLYSEQPWQQQEQANLPSVQTVQRPPAGQHNGFRSSQVKHRKINRKLLAIASLCLLLLVGVVSYALYQFVIKGPPNVTLYRVSMKSVNEDIGGGGIAYPVQRLDISYPFTANVLAVFVQPGDKVTPKQPLLQLDLSQVNAQYIAQLNAQVSQAYQNMLSAKAYLDSISTTGNPVQIARAQQQYANAQASYTALQDETSASSLRQGKITSSISGTVTAVNVYQGQSIAANRVLLTIYDESSLIIRTSMPLSDYGHIQINQSAQVIPSAMPNETYNGKVISIIPNANSQSGTFEVRVAIDNVNGDLLPGMSAFVHIQNTIRVLVVPRLTVLNPDMDSTVFLVRQQHVYIQHVQILGYEGDTLLIGSGVHANDLIVLVGLSSLHDGQTVHVTGIES